MAATGLDGGRGGVAGPVGWLASTLVLWWDTGTIGAAQLRKAQLQVEVRTRIARLWCYAVDDRPLQGPSPPAVFYRYAEDRRGRHIDVASIGIDLHSAMLARSQAQDPKVNDNDDDLNTPHIGTMTAIIEGLHQRVHILERTLVGVSMFATAEQRLAVGRMIDKAEASYTPIVMTWPEMRSTARPQMTEVVARYKALFFA